MSAPPNPFDLFRKPKAPAIPPPPPLPKPIDESKEVKARQEEIRRAAQRRKGRAATILTGRRLDDEEAPVVRPGLRTRLGG